MRRLILAEPGERAMNDVTQAPEAEPRQRVRPLKASRLETVSFYLSLKITERLDDAYYVWSAGVSRETRIGRVEFREMVLEKDLEHVQDIRKDE